MSPSEPETVEAARQLIIENYTEDGWEIPLLEAFLDDFEAAVRRDERERLAGPLCTACGKGESFWEHMFSNGHPFESVRPVSASGGAE
jgi:hypothetical protein